VVNESRLNDSPKWRPQAVQGKRKGLRLWEGGSKSDEDPLKGRREHGDFCGLAGELGKHIVEMGVGEKTSRLL